MERQKEEMVDQVGAEGSAGQSNNHSSQCLPLVRISREGDTTVCSMSINRATTSFNCSFKCAVYLRYIKGMHFSDTKYAVSATW